jgi:hypothetical protein
MAEERGSVPRGLTVASGLSSQAIVGADAASELRGLRDAPARSNEARGTATPGEGRSFEEDPVPGWGSHRRITQCETARILKTVQASSSRIVVTLPLRPPPWPEER